MFLTPGILTGLKALPNLGKTAKYLRDAAGTLTTFCTKCHYFLSAKPFPEN